MNELEKLREEFYEAIDRSEQVMKAQKLAIADAMSLFVTAARYAREIERQAGIGSDANA